MSALSAPLHALQNDKLSLNFSQDTGGCPANFRFFNGTGWVDLFRPATAEALADHNPQGMGGFVSMPYVSRISNGVFDFEGVRYTIKPNQPPSPHPLHGIIWRRPARIEQDSPTALSVHHHIDEPDFPFHFESRQDWQIEDATLHLTLTQTNRGDRALPFGMGLHPFFNKTPRSRMRTGVGKMITNNAEVIPVSLDPLPAANDFTRDFIELSRLPVDNCFTDWSRRCEIEWPDLNAALTMTADERFKFFVVCAPEALDWFCANPVSHFNDAYNNSIGLAETGLTVLAPGESMTGSIRISVHRE